MFLGAAEKDRIRQLDGTGVTPGTFDKYLPYALALDVEDAWAQQLAAALAPSGGIALARYTPRWYSGADLDLADIGRPSVPRCRWRSRRHLQIQAAVPAAATEEAEDLPVAAVGRGRRRLVKGRRARCEGACAYSLSVAFKRSTLSVRLPLPRLSSRRPDFSFHPRTSRRLTASTVVPHAVASFTSKRTSLYFFPAPARNRGSWACRRCSRSRPVRRPARSRLSRPAPGSRAPGSSTAM